MTEKARARELCKQLSLEEKIGQITHQITGFDVYEKENGEFVFSEEGRTLAEKT